jgi:aminotransferase
LAQPEAANRLKKIEPSGIRRMSLQTNNIPNAVNLGIGEPDFSSPPHILEAAKQALDTGKTRYTSTTGMPELIEALAKKAKEDYNLSYDPNTEILVTVGGTQAIFIALQALINPGDEVLVPDPAFVCYQPSVLMASGIPISVPLLEEDGFRLDPDAFASRITKKSRMIVINSPNNPTGSVFSHNNLSNLAKIANEHNLLVISDEVYEKITYDNALHYCFAGFPDMREQTLIIGSFSKTYAMTGFRVGYVYGPKELIAPMKLAQYYNVGCVNEPAQYAALAALKGPQAFTKCMVEEFDRRRKLVHSRLKETEGFRSTLPKGAFYMFPDIKDFGTTSEKFAEHLVNDAKVITVPGSVFGKHGEGYLRLSYATAYGKLEEALDRIEKTAKKFRKR